MRSIQECYEIARNPMTGSLPLEDEELKAVRKHVHATHVRLKALGPRYAIACKDLREMSDLLDRFYFARREDQRKRK